MKHDLHFAMQNHCRSRIARFDDGHYSVGPLAKDVGEAFIINTTEVQSLACKRLYLMRKIT